MDIKILDSWLRDYLDTPAKPEKIAECLSLCGPSIERIEKFESEFVYDIEVTTNRVDSASVYGIAREASAILPRFGVKAKLKTIEVDKTYKFAGSVSYLKAQVDKNLCPRFTAVLIRNVKIGDSPEWMVKKLESAEVRSINNVVDISNYIMLALGQPVHTFDYDKIKGSKMILRESKKGEKIKTLDSKEFTLMGGDIVIEDGAARLIDLAGIMGGNLSAVDANTKNVLLFVQTYNPIAIRKTSMALAQRTMAATIFEKGTDPELVAPAITTAINLFQKLTGGVPEKQILDIYKESYKEKSLTTDLQFIVKILGQDISKKDVDLYLTSLGFKTSWSGKKISVKIPSYRAQDIKNQEDIVEEVARIFGYHNLPSQIMTGEIPGRAANPTFEFESQIKKTLMGWGGTEVYTLSLVQKSWTNDRALKLKNPLGTDSEYLRTSLMPSILYAANENIGTFDKFHIFEMANVYLPRVRDLPDEKLTLAGIFSGYEYRGAKGIVEGLMRALNISAVFETEEYPGFAAGKSASIKVKGSELGKIGYVENSSLIYYEFDIATLMQKAGGVSKYQKIPKYPAQIEDLTFIFPEKTKLGEVLHTIKQNAKVSGAELTSVYQGAITLRIWFQDEEKTMTNEDVQKVRAEILSLVRSKFGGNLKD